MERPITRSLCRITEAGKPRDAALHRAGAYTPGKAEVYAKSFPEMIGFAEFSWGLSLSLVVGWRSAVASRDGRFQLRIQLVDQTDAKY